MQVIIVCNNTLYTIDDIGKHPVISAINTFKLWCIWLFCHCASCRAGLFSESQRIQYTIQTRTQDIPDARSYLLALKEIRIKYVLLCSTCWILYFRYGQCGYLMLQLTIVILNDWTYTSLVFSHIWVPFFLFPCAGGVSQMIRVWRLWCLMHWKKLKMNSKSPLWGMTRKEWLFLWQSLIKSIRSKCHVSSERKKKKSHLNLLSFKPPFFLGFFCCGVGELAYR